MKSAFSVYLGEEKEGCFLGFIAENNLFLIIEVDLDKEKGREVLKKIHQDIISSQIISLATFETYLSQAIRQTNLPLGFSLAAGYLIDNTFYIKTINEGEIYIRRGKELAKIISGSSSASGYIKDGDFLIFANTYFNEVLGGIESMRRILDHKKPAEIVEELTPEMKGKDDNQAIALMVCFEKEEEEIATLPAPTAGSLVNKVKESFYRLNNLPENYQKKKFTFIFVVIIFIILVWSVGFGYRRRQEIRQLERIAAARQSIEKKLIQADEKTFLDLADALSYLSQAKTELKTLKKTTNKKYLKEINSIGQLISSTESKLLKKEAKNYREFYDLAMENKQAQGTRLSLDQDKLLIINNTNNTCYLLSLTKKSLEKKNRSGLKTNGLMAFYQDLIFVYIPHQGIYKIEDGKAKKIIDNDKDWKEPIDLKIYNGNIYLLDKGSDEVYKYLTAEGGYSTKQSYFTAGGAIDLSDARSMAIDGAIYISFSNYIAKYLSGVRDQFKTNFPEESFSLTKVFTSRDLEKVFGWDKDQGVIYVMAKNGLYEKQINSSIISKATDFVVYDSSIYLLLGGKIYIIDL